MEVEISQFSSRTLFKQQAEHCAFFSFFFFPDGVSVDSILVIFYLSFLPRSLPPPRYSQSAVCALACVITALPHWRLLLLHACVSVRACVCRCNSVA